MKSPEQIHHLKVTKFFLEVNTHSREDEYVDILLACHALLTNVEKKCVTSQENVCVGDKLQGAYLLFNKSLQFFGGMGGGGGSKSTLLPLLNNKANEGQVNCRWEIFH